MTAARETDLVSTCSNLADRALSAAQEIESFLSGRIDVAEPELQKLRYLSTKLQQLHKDVGELQAKLRAASGTSRELQEVLSTQLPGCNDTATTVIKQLMRLARDTPREMINVATILLYESFAEATTRFVFLATTLLSIGDVEVQQANLGSQNAKLVLNAVASACRDAAGSDGILLEAEIAGRNISSKGAVLDTTPPGYTASDDPPPAFEESSDFAYAKAGFTKADAGSSSNHHNKGSSDGFLRSLAGPFKAATAALRSKPEPLVVALCQAATNGNVAQIRSLLAEGANINGRNESGQTALICAIHAGQLDAVKVLLDAGADHARRDAGSKGNPPLIHAIQAGNRPAAELLLKHGADPNQKDEWGETYVIPLITGDTAPEWIALLLSHGADPSAKDMSGRPLAVLAIQKRKRLEDREEVVRLLLQHGAKPDSSDMDGTPLIHICLQQKRSGLAHELLAKGANPNARDVSGISLLAAAIKNSDRDLARAVLDRGADPNAPDIYGSPLLLNVLRDSKFPGADREALAEMLLEHGARGGEKDLYGVTALEHSLAPIVQGITAVPSFSAGYTKLKIPELLLQRGADPNQCLTKVSGEPRVLAYAVERGLWDLAALVLRHGANANAVDKKGRTPLVQAVQAGNVEAVALLIQHGANVNLPGPTLPLDVAMGTGESEIVDLLKAHGAGSSGNAA